MARIKRVFGSTEEVAHIWANNEDANREVLTSGRRVFARGMVIYSYGEHYPIARKVKLPQGKLVRSVWHDEVESNAPGQGYVVLFNAVKSSMSTEHHKSLARRAASQFRAFEVPYPVPKWPQDTNPTLEFKRRADHVANLAALVKRAKNERDEAKRRKSFGLPDMELIRAACRDAVEYAQIFRLPVPNLPVVQWIAETETLFAERAARRADKIAKWEARNAELIEQYRAGSLAAAAALERAPRFIAEPISAEWGDTHDAHVLNYVRATYPQWIEEYRAGRDIMPATRDARGKSVRTAEERAAQFIRDWFEAEWRAAAGARLIADHGAAIARYRGGEHYDTALEELPEADRNAAREIFHDDNMTARVADDIAQWRAGVAGVSLPYEFPVMLRVRGDNIETSRRASFPVEHGRRALPLLLRARARLTADTPRIEFKSDGAAIRLGHFTVSEINREGVRAGCHFVTWNEVCHAARLIGEDCLSERLESSPDRDVRDDVA
jgi:hypothetical protein